MGVDFGLIIRKRKEAAGLRYVKAVEPCYRGGLVTCVGMAGNIPLVAPTAQEQATKAALDAVDKAMKKPADKEPT